MRTFTLVGAFVAALLPVNAVAQDADFLFEQPRFSTAARGSWIFARASSDIFTFVEENLTIEKRDFSTPAVATEFGVALSPHVETLFGFEYSKAGVSSQYRGYTRRSTGGPITQHTSLETIGVNGSVKVALLSPGQRIGKLAWVPRLITPYVGAGGGVIKYDFTQEGAFVDFVDLAVFEDVFTGQGWTPSAHVFGGADVRLSRRVFLSVEGRYQWAAGDLGSSFAEFEPIDLTGFRASTGINIRF